MLSEKTKQCTADILIPRYHTKGQSLQFSDTNSGWWATPPSVLNLRSKWPTPVGKRRLRQISAYNVLREIAKKVQLWRIRSRPRAFQRAVDGVRTLPLSPQRVAQKAIFCFSNKIQFQSDKVCCKASLCENLQRQSCTNPSTKNLASKWPTPLKSPEHASRGLCHSWATCTVNKSARSKFGKTAASLRKSPTGRFDNDGESGRWKTDSLLRRTSFYQHCGLSQHPAHIATVRRSPVLKIDVAASAACICFVVEQSLLFC